MCKITDDHGKLKGTAFLAKFPMADSGVISGGILTNNHVLSKKDLADGKTFRIQSDTVLVSDSTNPSGSPLVLTVPATGKFRFTCPLLDVTFVRLNDDVIRHLLSSGCQFLDISEREGASEQVFVLQYRQDIQGLRLAYGFCLQYYGTDLFHSANSFLGSSGSPVVLSSGKVIGIHKSAGPANNYKIAVAIKPVIKAIHELKHSFCRKLFYNPPLLNKSYVDRLLALGLQQCGSHSKFEHLYVSPATYRLHILRKKPPVWFVPTVHGWYWTPTDPSDKEKHTNWMPVSQLQVNGGDLDDQILSEDNVRIINWLCQHNIVCCKSFSHPPCRSFGSDRTFLYLAANVTNQN